ncbi:MAG: SusD family outer membrane lipoprotein NanU [Ginsengibacter sp.]
MKNNIIKIFTGAALVLLTFSCAKKLDLAPVSSITDENFWQSPEQVATFVNGVNARFRNNTAQFISLGELRADIFGTDPGSNSVFTGEATQGVERAWLNTLDPDAAGVSGFGGFYSNINQINLLINKLNTINVVSPGDKNYYLGLAYGMRAFYYFQLVRSWGDVIIQKEPTTSIDIAHLAKAASSAADVLKFIKEDITASENSFGNDFSFRQNKGYWSKSATLMLKAEVYLWTSYRGGGAGDATVAKTALTTIQTNVPTLSLLPVFSNVFEATNKGNAEIIFAIRFGLNEASLPIAGTFLPQSGLIANFYDSAGNRQFNSTTDNWGGLLRAPILISTFRRFDDNDTRKWATIQPAYNKVGGNYVIAGAFVSKYKGEQAAGSRTYSNDFPIYRYADLLLLLAEAKIILGQDPSNEINLVRARAYGSNYNPAVQGYPNQAIDANPKEALLEERYKEFIFEGKRWYDLRRMGDQYVYEHTTITSTNSFRLLWPINRGALTDNSGLVQNPGYF